MKKKVVILISGSGTNMVSLVEATRTNDFPAEVVAVISDNKDAKGIEKARILGLSTYIIERKNFTDKQNTEEGRVGKRCESRWCP